VQQDLSDLSETLEALQHNDLLAQQIALEGQALGMHLFSRECVDEYICRLLAEYAKVFKSRYTERGK
jgi:hypothetical protein